MNWNDATLEQCRDFLAKCKGWIYDQEDESWYHKVCEPHNRFVGCRHGDHPIPSTLDSIAASLPEGWWFWVNYCAVNGVDTYYVQIVNKRTLERREARADTELLARARCSCLVREASGK